MRRLQCIPIVAIAVLLSSCGSEDPSEQSSRAEGKELNNEVDEVESDTIWEKDMYFNFQNRRRFVLDTTFRINETGNRIKIVSLPLNEELVAINSWEKDGKIHAQRSHGKNRAYKVTLYDEDNELYKSNIFTKKDLLKFGENVMLAESEGDYLAFDGYHEKFGQFLLDFYFMHEDSDVGVETLVFLDRNGELKNSIVDNFTGGGACDCDHQPSPNGKTFAFCSGILRSDGTTTEMNPVNAELAGIFILNNEYVLAIETYDGKPPFRNAKIMTRFGGLVKSFDFQGIEEGLGYSIPEFRIEEENAFYLYDDVQASLIQIDLNAPKNVVFIPLDDLPSVVEPVAIAGERFSVYGFSEGDDIYYYEGILYLDRRKK